MTDPYERHRGIGSTHGLRLPSKRSQTSKETASAYHFNLHAKPLESKTHTAVDEMVGTTNRYIDAIPSA
jgi:hypothetical protein